MNTWQIIKDGAALTGALTYAEALQKVNTFKRADVENAAAYTVELFMPNRPVVTATPAAEAAAAPVYVRADEVKPGTPVVGYTGPDPVVMVHAAEHAARPGVEFITWKTASGAVFTEETASRYLIPTAPAAL